MKRDREDYEGKELLLETGDMLTDDRQVRQGSAVYTAFEPMDVFRRAGGRRVRYVAGVHQGAKVEIPFLTERPDEIPRPNDGRMFRRVAHVLQGAKVTIPFLMEVPGEIFHPKDMTIQVVGNPGAILTCDACERWISCDGEITLAVNVHVQFTSSGDHTFTAVPVPKSRGQSFLDGGRSVRPASVSVLNRRQFRWLGAPAKKRLRERFTFIHCWRVSADEGVPLRLLPVELVRCIIKFV